MRVSFSALSERVDHTSRSVDREPSRTGIVEEGLPWRWKSVEDRLDKLEKRARRAKRLFDDSRDEEYRKEAVDIYSDLRDLGAGSRIGGLRRRGATPPRLHRYIDAKHLPKTAVVIDSDCRAFQAGFKKCCDLTDAHDSSIGRNADPPAPSEILKDIHYLKDWTTSLRARQKLIT